jgi:alginate O-acetyltransferase complex protein AlgI
MLFNSYTFVAFFIIILILHHLKFLSWKTKKINLLIASYIFYAAWNPPFILLLWLSTVVDYFVGKALYNEENRRKKNLLLVLSLCGNLGMLCFFKYGGFLLENFTLLVNAVGISFHPAKPNIILPAGISFYTFTTLCYTIDMYKKHSKPVDSMLDFALFVTFFPHLVAGPIVRPEQLATQFLHPKQGTRDKILQGLFLITMGLFMKVVLADGMLSKSADIVFNTRTAVLPIDAWLGVLAFSGQIFFDFAGYSTCAIGAAMCLGFWLPQNFRYPYAAAGFSDFWKRWHITLSSWLRDYLYIPLGGNRKGELRTYINLMATMLLGGLWHGANWTFVVWGGLHGTYLCIERMFRFKRIPNMAEPVPVVAAGVLAPDFMRSKAMNTFLLALITFFFVNITWVFFRAQDFSTAWRLLSSMFGIVKNGAPVLQTLSMIKVSVVVIGMVITHWFMRNTTMLEVAEKTKWWVVGIVWTLMLLALCLSQESSSSFIYFQF